MKAFYIHLFEDDKVTLFSSQEKRDKALETLCMNLRAGGETPEMEGEKIQILLSDDATVDIGKIGETEIQE